MKVTALASAVLFSVVCFAASPTIGEPFNTENASSDVHLDNGVNLHLSSRSTGTVFTDHVILEKGAAQVTNFTGYKVDAGPFQIESETPNAQASVRIRKDTIEISSIGGNLRVFSGGALLTGLTAGGHLSFQNSGDTSKPTIPGQTGAAPGKKPRSEMKTWAWVVVGVSAAALAIGLTAAAQGKSPF